MKTMARTVEWLKDDWKFTRTPGADAFERDGDDADWQTVRVPHDWAIAGPFDRENDIERKVRKGQADVEGDVREITGRTGGLPHTGEGWYRRWIDVPADDSPRCYRLECDGIMSHSTVYCNGRSVGGWPYGYSSFALDLTDFIEPGKPNLIAVHVNNPEHSSRWYPGAGIYRHVRFITLAKAHIDHWGVAITTPTITDERGTVQVRTTVVDRDGAQPVQVRTTVFNPQGETVGEDTADARDSVVEQSIDIDKPARWSLDNPVQYTLRTEIIVGGQVTDSLANRFGFRTLRFEVADGLFLNDEPIRMKGVCMHHDLGPLGAAFNEDALRRQMAMLKEMGCNAIRTSHNPPAPALPALASEMGMLVIDEMFDEWKHVKMPNGYHTLWEQWAERDARALIRRDRNHPAVIMWSTGNEIPEQGKEDGAAISQFLVDICHDEDPTRPTTAGLNHFGSELNQALACTLDIPGWNYQPHNYGHARAALPDKPTYGSETASTVSSRGEYYFPAVDEIHLVRDTLQVNSYDMSYPGWATAPDIEFQAQDAFPFIMGEFVWTGFDYLGEPTPYSEQWPSRSSYFGIIDLAGIPKDRFYLYQSQWADQPVLHLMPHWTWPGLEGQPIPVQCYTTHKVVELLVNGRSMGKRNRYPKGRVLQSNYRFFWDSVPYEPGELTVMAYDRKGNLQDQLTIRTAGEPAAIDLQTDRPALSADGDSMAFVTLRVVDGDGNLCPRADDSLSFKVEGPAEIAGLCNGDATSLESFQGDSMKAFNGMCVVYLRSVERKTGPITLTASADGLGDGVVELTAD
jgi:beta-galactosidase